MTRTKKLSIINFAIYLAIFITDIILVGMVKDSMLGALDALFGGDFAIGNVASAAVMILALLMLIICGIASVINMVLKILQASFDKWGFSVASVVIDSLMVLWTGIVSVSYLSGTAMNIGAVSLALFLAAVFALTLECVVITKRKDT